MLGECRGEAPASETGDHAYFAHDLYRGDRLYAGGLVVVEARADAKFNQAFWVTKPDARELRLSSST
jgi:hypothetical protein